MKDARMSTKARSLAAAVLVAATVAVMLPIAWHGTPIGHDTIHHLAWATEFTQSLAAGILYPRWLPDVNGGLGNPTFIFYGPALFYLAALVRPLAGATARSLSLAAGASLLVSGIAVYRYLRGGLNRPWALLGAVASLWLPYRLLDLYERGALAEFAAFAWPPLVLLALRRLASAPTWVSAGPAALGLAAAGASPRPRGPGPRSRSASGWRPSTSCRPTPSGASCRSSGSRGWREPRTTPSSRPASSPKRRPSSTSK